MRKEERFQTNLLSTNLGEVVDVSGSGVRIRCNGRPGLTVGQVVPLTIRSPQCKVVVHSRVVRTGRGNAQEGRGQHASFQFLDAKPGLRAAIAHLGRFGFIPNLDYSGGENDTPSGGKRSIRPRRKLADYYGMLGVGPRASADEIRRAYHQLAKQHHPDHTRDTESVGMFEALVEAYKVLRDPEQRKAYDTALAENRSAA